MRANPMGDVSFNRTLIDDEPLPLTGSTAKGDQILGLMSAGWTNEKHSTYISSMEASFVDQLYGLRKHGPGFGNDEFKAVQEDICKNIGFEGINSGGSQPVGTWVRRFRPNNAAVNPRGNVRDASIDDYGSGTDSVQRKVQTNGREAKTCAEENLIEVSDQNFSEEDVEASEEPCKRRRPASTIAEPNDQPT